MTDSDNQPQDDKKQPETAEAAETTAAATEAAAEAAAPQPADPEAETPQSESPTTEVAAAQSASPADDPQPQAEAAEATSPEAEPVASEPVSTDKSAESPAAETAAPVVEATAPEATAPEATATEGTATEGTATEIAATEGAAAEGTVAEAAAVEAATAEGAAVEGTAVESAAVESAATEGAVAEGAVAEGAAAATETAEAEPEQTLEEVLATNPQLAEINAAIRSRVPVEGKVIGWNKGGFHVTLNGTPAFCPKSQIELGKPKKASSYIDRNLTFRVLEIKDLGKRIVVSRADILSEQRRALLGALEDHVKSGEPLHGKVSSITDFGAFVDLGGLEGLVHLSQLSRKRVETPRDVVQVGNDVLVKVTKIEKGGERISLSMKALEPDPWKNADERYPTGNQFTGKIMRKTDFGLFVELEDGLEGLVHTSQLPLGKKIEDKDYNVGNEITGWIRDANPERRRLSLALREVATTNPWKDVHERFDEGAEVVGQVEQVAKFGVFVMLEPGLTGLLPFSAMQRGPNSTARPPLPGQDIKVQIASIDAKKRRISLAPLGSKLEGTKADFQDFKKSTTEGTSSGLGQMAAAFAHLKK